MLLSSILAVVASTAVGQGPVVGTGTWVGGTGTQLWNSGANWSLAPNYPSGIGADAIFAGPTAARTINAAEAITIGSIYQSNDLVQGTPANSTIGAGGGSLTFDSYDEGPALVTVEGAGNGNLTISAPSTLIDSLIATVNQLSPSSAAGALNWTGAISGTGGVTKRGAGLMTFGTWAKTYTGPTVLEDGRFRISAAARPQGTSSFTVLNGGQITLLASSGSETYTLGTGALNLNGFGPQSGPFAPFPGAIRNDRALVTTITNPVVLQSDSLIHVQTDTVTGAGSTTLSGGVSGPGGLFVNAVGSDQHVGSVVLTGTGTYTGVTVVNSGTLRAAAVGSAAMGGTGAITVRSGAKVGLLELGAADQINDTAPITLESAVFGTSGFSDTVGTLNVIGVSILDFGSGNSVLNFANSSGEGWLGTLNIHNWSGNPGVGGGLDQLFFGTDATGLTGLQLSQINFFTDAGITSAGTGGATILTNGEVVPIPEPGAVTLLLGAFATLLGIQRFRRMG